MLTEEQVNKIEDFFYGWHDSYIRDLLADRRELVAELARLKSGKFTAEEIHNICHNLHGTVSAEGFEQGCDSEIRKLFGRNPCRDALRELADAWVSWDNDDQVDNSVARARLEVACANARNLLGK
jgi:hypothetical protein